MKKKFYLIIILFISSCSSNRVCGGKGGKRCVEIASRIENSKIS